MVGFQASVNAQPSPAVEGDFASDNPRFSMDAGPGALVADITLGVLVGRFAWADVNGVAHNAYPAGASPVARLGFVAREGNEFPNIGWGGTSWIDGASLLVPPGYPITLHTSVDIWARAVVANGTIGQKAYARFSDGAVIPGAAATAPTATFTANTTNGAATLVNVSTAVAAGQPVSGAGIPASTVIITGAAIGGTAVMSANATATATGITVTGTTAVETDWKLVSAGLIGELIKLSKGG